MKITKLMHACLLLEDRGSVVLVDPGDFSWETGLLTREKIGPALDAVVYTHAHSDHFFKPALQRLLEWYPLLKVVACSEVADLLAQDGIAVSSMLDVPSVSPFASRHESILPLSPAPESHSGFHLFGRVTIPGDSHNFAETKEVLALPISAPWGSLSGSATAVEALATKPKVIVPIHDWHLNAEARAQAHRRLKDHFASQGIEVVQPNDGEPISL